MSLLQLVRVQIGEVGVLPGEVKMLATDSLVTITTAGYLNNNGTMLANVQLSPLDIIECLYNFNQSTGTAQYVTLTVSSSGGVITLAPSTDLATLTNTHIFVGNASNVAKDVAMSGDATMANTGALTIANSAITNAKVSASAAIAFSKLATLATGHILAGNAGVVTDVTLGGDATIGATGTLTIANSAITNVKVSASAAIDYSKLAALTSGNILVGSAGNVATSVAMSGDATIIASGALTIAANAVTSSKIALNTLQYVAVPITLANFIAMYTTPVQLVAAGAANTLIVLEEAVIMQTYGSAPLADGGVVAIQYDSTVHGAGVYASNSEAAADLFVTASTSYQFTPTSGNTVGALPFATTVQKGLYLSAKTGDFTGGTGSTFVAHIWYRVVPTV